MVIYHKNSQCKVPHKSRMLIMIKQIIYSLPGEEKERESENENVKEGIDDGRANSGSK